MKSAHDSNQPLTVSAVLLTLLTVVLWAGTPTAVRFSTVLVPPVAVAGLRFAVAIVFMFFWSLSHGTSLKLSWIELRKPMIGGVLLFFQIGLFTLGIHWSNASHGTIVINTFIFWLVAIDHYVTKSERLNPRRISGLALAAFAVALILLTTARPGTETVPEAAALDGDLLLILSAVILAVKIAYTKHSVGSIHPDSFVFWHAVFGTVLFAGWAFAVEGFRFSLLANYHETETQSALAGIAYQGIVVAGLCFAIQARLLKKHSASKIAVFSFATPLFGILFAVLLRGDPVSPWLFVSGIAVAIGILLVNLNPASTNLREAS
ncbi:MAG: DMT family transporter [Planctomycetota bacterium]|nr:DMT family transporter [Planctomycetota bacterium]MDA1164323.1 DMT family transporter [Planctomycetota bacterium]